MQSLFDICWSSIRENIDDLADQVCYLPGRFRQLLLEHVSIDQKLLGSNCIRGLASPEFFDGLTVVDTSENLENCAEFWSQLDRKLTGNAPELSDVHTFRANILVECHPEQSIGTDDDDDNDDDRSDDEQDAIDRSTNKRCEQESIADDSVTKVIGKCRNLRALHLRFLHCQPTEDLSIPLTQIAENVDQSISGQLTELQLAVAHVQDGEPIRSIIVVSEPKLPQFSSLQTLCLAQFDVTSDVWRRTLLSCRNTLNSLTLVNVRVDNGDLLPMNLPALVTLTVYEDRLTGNDFLDKKFVSVLRQCSKLWEVSVSVMVGWTPVDVMTDLASLPALRNVVVVASQCPGDTRPDVTFSIFGSKIETLKFASFE